SLIESRSKLTIVNSTIANNVINTSANGANGGDNLIWTNNDNSDISISNSIITYNTIVKSGKGLFFNSKGSINVEYCDISNNDVGSFVGSTGTITANNNWWGTNDRPDSKVDNWVIMNVEVDDSDLTENNKVTLTVDFNHVKTSSGTVEELTGGEIPKDSYSIDLSAQNGEITPSAIVVQKGEVKTETFTVTNVNDVITLNCDGDIVEITIEGIAPYRGIIYVNKTGDDNNEGSIDAPVASLTKAIELANDGIGQIIIDEGTYTGFGYQVTKDLNITGVGKVTLDANNQGGLFATGYPTNANMLILTNLNLAGANADYGQVINSYANELVLNNVNITDNPGSGSLIIQSGKLTVDNCIIANHNGGAVISDSSSAQIIIKNTLFENNTVIDNAVCYLSGYSGDLIIENTQFINNTGKLGIVKSNKKINVKDSKFIDNTNTNSYGGAISDCDEFTITNSAFINNKAAKDGGAIYIGYNRDAIITKSTFIDNVANTQGGNYHGDAIYNHGKLLINYCVLLSNAGNSVIYSESEQDVNAQLNWWGTNDDPSSLNGVGTYEDDDYNEVDCVIDSSNWVYMNVTTNMTGDSLNVGDKVEITVDFTNYIDSTNTLRPLLDRLPEITVSAGKVSRSLDANEVTTVDGIAKFVYTADEAGEYAIRVASGDAVVEIPITVEEAADEIVYVDGANGLDTNDGKTRETAVKTIEHAVEIANGKIIILTGEYTVGSLLNITKDLDIAGEGDVTVKSNVAQTVTYEEWDDWDEEWVTKTKTVYTLIENNANLNLSNIKFTLVPASINMEMITNNANLFINTCEFTNIKVTSSKGVIQNIKTAKLEVNGTTFTASSSTYGAINSNGELLVNNSKFADADRSGEGTVYSTAITAYNRATIVNSEFKNNKGGAGGAVYVMYSYTNKENPVVEINNCIFEDNEATGTYGDGAAIKCSGNQVTLTVTNSTFNNNVAVRNGGAIYAQGTVNVDQCVFTENVAATANTLYAYSGTIDISNSIILDDATPIERYESTYSEPAVVTANDNWWGTNDKPNDYAETWVKMDASFDPANAQAGDEVTVTATFDNDKLPSGVIDVTFTSTSGNLNQVVTVENAKATVTYTIDANDADITATSGSASVVMPIQSPVPAGTIYVSYENGVDTNDGLSEASAVKTIAHAIELADAGIGKIILLEGTHVLSGTLFPTKDLDIKGQGVAIIDGNHDRFIQTTAGLNLTNIEFTNGYSSGSNLINLASSGTYLSLDKVKFYGNSAKYGVAAPADKRLVINNSEFYDNNLFAANQNSLGVIYSNSAITTIENTVFRNNIAQKGGAIWANRATSATIGGFVDIINCTFDSNIAQNGNGAAIFMSGSVTVTVANSTFTNNLANASANNVGGYGSAVYIGTGTGKITITQSVFINNTGNGNNYNDAGFYIGAGTLDVSDSIILTNDGDTRYAINQAGGTVTAENNWWGNNDQANTNAVVNKIVTMTATLNPENARIGDEATITVSFDNENLPKGVINVSFTSSSGLLNEAVTMDGAEASVVYTIDENDLSITVKSSQAEIVFPFDPEAGIIFVLPGADDTNPGTRDAPV
ncbi:MAG: hypothetical protein Q4Q14_05845, partial [Methanobrevibacter sp.]|nr:hypothetical protein [Methanobrevibacter sp.]